MHKINVYAATEKSVKMSSSVVLLVLLIQLLVGRGIKAAVSEDATEDVQENGLPNIIIFFVDDVSLVFDSLAWL